MRKAHVLLVVTTALFCALTAPAVAVQRDGRVESGGGDEGPVSPLSSASGDSAVESGEIGDVVTGTGICLPTVSPVRGELWDEEGSWLDEESLVSA